MKNILITGGPTNEYIDEVMKITNMSSGRIAIELARYFADAGDRVTLLITRTIKSSLLDGIVTHPNIEILKFETTDELANLINDCAKKCNYDIVVHSAAVADYKPEYSFRLEDMASEIANFIGDNARYINESYTTEDIRREIFEILANPKCKVNDNTKISSVEPNLTVKLGLTPKIIANLRVTFPNAYICGFKLLENVTENELIAASLSQIQKCKTDIVFANDLAELRKGNSSRLVITKSGYSNVNVDGASGIFHLLKIVTTD